MMINKKKVTLSLDTEIYGEFHDYCKQNAIMISRKVEIWIQNFLKNEKRKKKR